MIDPRDPAFPQTEDSASEAYISQGINIRAYLAAKAMQGLCANAGLFAAFQEPRKMGLQGGLTASDMDSIERKAIAAISVAFADALIQALNEKQP